MGLWGGGEVGFTLLRFMWLNDFGLEGLANGRGACLQLSTVYVQHSLMIGSLHLTPGSGGLHSWPHLPLCWTGSIETNDLPLSIAPAFVELALFTKFVCNIPRQEAS